MALQDRPDLSGLGDPPTSESELDREVRIGTVIAVNAGPPKTVTVDDGSGVGRPMRYLLSYAAPATSDIVYWLRVGSGGGIVLGEVAS